MVADPQTDRIDVARLLAASPVAQVEYFESIGSTHDVAHERARDAGTPLPLLIVADEQTAGRGRGQNRWWTGEGSLAFSLVFDPRHWELPGDLRPQRALAVGVGIVETVAPLVPAVEIGLHWPNDVFAGERKIAGVLVDVLSGGRHVIGIGLNTNNSLDGAPPEVVARATSLRDLAERTFDRTDLLIALLANLRRALRASAEDPEAFGQRFNTLCLQRGRTLTIDVAGVRTSGICTGIAADGALLLETPEGLRPFYSGVLVH